MKKLKDILSEGYAWERKAGKPLPTLAEVQAEYQRNEAANDAKAKVAKLEKEIADLKHQYYSDKNLTAEKSQILKRKLGPKVRELKNLKREVETGTARYNPNPERKSPTSPSSKPQPRWQDNDGDGIWYEPGVDVKENVNEVATLQQQLQKTKPGKPRKLEIMSIGDVELQSDDDTKQDQESGRIWVGTVDTTKAPYVTTYFGLTITVTNQGQEATYEIVDQRSFDTMIKAYPGSIEYQIVNSVNESILHKNLRRFGVKNLKI